jgi:hypothetical protein
VRDLLTRRILHLLGMLAVLPLVAVDPVMITLLFDAGMLVLIGSAGVALLHGDARLVWLRLRDSHFVLEMRVAATLTRERPGSLLEC